MKNISAVISMLHESADVNSAMRTFRRDPVLHWTLERLTRSRHLESIAILCWDDQAEAINPIAAEVEAHMMVKSPRQTVPMIESIAAAQKFADGWRGGLHGTCDFDRGFFAPWFAEIAKNLESDTLLLVDPTSALIDPQIIDATIEQAREKMDAELFFSQAAPGLAAPLIRVSLLDRLIKLNLHPGRILHYIPDQPMRDPIGGESCVTVPTVVARTTRQFKLDSRRQIERITAAAHSLNGTLISSSSVEILNRVEAFGDPEPMPRDVTMELTTRRDAKPIFLPEVSRGDLSLQAAKKLFGELAEYDDIRLTLGGVGDPLLHGQFLEIIAAARSGGIHAIHVETDLLADAQRIEQLVDANVDVVSVHLPAMKAETYARIMGVDRLADAVTNIKRFVTHRQRRRRGVPLLVPTFVKLAINLSEMELWYDQWLRALGSAVIVGPSDFAGQVSSIAVAEMQPPRRTACRRIESRITILSDGSIVSCEQDVFGKQAMGSINTDSISDVWRNQFGKLRIEQAAGRWCDRAMCAGCKEWHRP
jgi:radical SAM protein with 4Fe4S-binding SPASM domain